MNEILLAKHFILEKLKERIALLGDNDIIPIETPPSLEGYKLSHPIGAVLVVYAGSTYANREAINKVIQDRTLKFGIVIKVRDIPGKMKPEQYIQYVIDSLTGLKYKNELIYFTEETFMEEVGGVWTYFLDLIVKDLYVDKQV